VIDLLPLTRFGNDVLDVAGPCLLTGAQLDYDAQPPVRVDSCHLFCAEDKEGKQTVPYLPVTPSPLARHHWASTWWRPARRHGPLGTALRTAAFSMRHKLTRGRVLDGAQARAVVAPEVLARSAPSGNNVAILVPVRDAAAHIGPFFEKVQSLDHPKSAIKLVFCEGDSVDDTWDRVNVLASAHRAGYRNVVLARRHMGVEFSRQARWNRPLQRRRRAALAAVRNQLIDIGLDTTDDWALWIDVDVWQFPPDIIAHLIAAKARIVAPHCVRYPGGPTYDLNSFVARTIVPRYRYLKHLHDGLYQPPRSAWGRSYMDGLRHSSRVPLDGVGGTMLLVDAALHRGGLRFPELPYRDHIETEGLGLLARDLGVGAVGLPRVEILHAPW
jgi:hypothetical protein